MLKYYNFLEKNTIIELMTEANLRAVKEKSMIKRENDEEKQTFHAIILNPNQEKELQDFILKTFLENKKCGTVLYPFFPTFIKLENKYFFRNQETSTEKKILPLQELFKKNAEKILLDNLHFEDEKLIFNCIIKIKNEDLIKEELVAGTFSKTCSKDEITSFQKNFFSEKDFKMLLKIFKICRIEKNGFTYSYFDEKWIKIK